MLKRDITFNDQFDGTPVTETHYFNLNITELMEIDLEAILKRLSGPVDTPTVAKNIKIVILAAIGERDGKYFIKEPYVQQNFQRTGAYNALVVELSTDANGAAEFIKGLLPAELAAQYEKAMAEEAAKELEKSTIDTAAVVAPQSDTPPPAA